MLHSALALRHSHSFSCRRFVVQVQVQVQALVPPPQYPQRRLHSTPPQRPPTPNTIQQLLILSCFLITPYSHPPSPAIEATAIATAWSQCLIHCLQQPSPLPPSSAFARSAVAFDRWLSSSSSSASTNGHNHHPTGTTVASALLTHLLSTQTDPTATPTATILYTLHFLQKYSQSSCSSSTLPVTPADYLHTHVLPHLTHVLTSSVSAASSTPTTNRQLNRILTHPLVTSSPSPDLLLTRLHLLATTRSSSSSPGPPPSLPTLHVHAWPLLTATHINALWTLFTPPVALRSRTSHRPLASLWHLPRSLQPNPALLAQLVANVPLANWNTTTWILAAHCPYLNPVDVARAYLGMTRVAFLRQASASYVEWISAPDKLPSAASAATGTSGLGLVRGLNPVVRTRNLLVLTVLLERLIQQSAAPNYAIADALLDAARGLDWDTRFLNAVLEGYAASGQWHKARYVYEDLIKEPDVYTLRVMVKYYAKGHDEVGKVLRMVSKRAKGGKVDLGPWAAYWLVRSALQGSGAAADSSSSDAEGAEAEWTPESPPPSASRVVEPSDGMPSLPAIPLDANNWATAHAILDHLLSVDPNAVMPVTCHLVLRAYARAGQVTKLERLLRLMRAKGKVHAETYGLVMMGYVVHMRGWLSPRARYTSGWQADVVRERGFEDVWRVFEEHVEEAMRARQPVAASAVHWLLVAHPPSPMVARRTLRVLSEVRVGLDESHLRHLWRLAYRLTTRGKVRASVQEVYARFVRQVRRQFAADPEKVGEWEEWIKGYCGSRRVLVRHPVVVAGTGGTDEGGDIVEWLLERLMVD